MPVTVTYVDFDDLENYILSNIKPNGNYEIEGQEHQNVEIGLLDAVRKSPLNHGKAAVRSGTNPLVVTIPVNVFIIAPSSLSWTDNIYNQYVFVNTTVSDIPLLSGTYYYDINRDAVDKIPAKSVVTIMKASNDLWFIASVPYVGNQASIPPLTGVVDRGGANDPVSGQSIFQSNKLIGLGVTNSGEISFNMAGTIWENYGDNKSFDFNLTTGEIDISPNEFVAGSSIYINLNQ